MSQLQRRLAPCLWFDGQAEAAAMFYTGIFQKKIDLNELERAAKSGVSSMR